eukprot:Skav220045  [mRNA]  locus=scaffold2981:338729:339205:- [translate_table: standard]
MPDGADGEETVSKIKEHVLALFKQCDKNGDGKLGEGELKDILKVVSAGSLSEEEIEELFEKLDRDADGKLSVSEFLDYVFDDDSAAGKTVETIDQIKEFAESEQAQMVGNAVLDAYNSELGQKLADGACEYVGIDKDKMEAVAGAVGNMANRAMEWWS